MKLMFFYLSHADLEEQNSHPSLCSKFLFTVEDKVSSITVEKRLSNQPPR